MAILATAHHGSAQNTPLISGGAGFFTTTNGGNPSYLPIMEPLIAAPLGSHLLVESRATLLESFAPRGGGKAGLGGGSFATAQSQADTADEMRPVPDSVAVRDVSR